MHESTIELNDFQKEIWLNNYKAPSDNTIEDTFRRVANTIAAVEEDQQTRKLLQQNYYKLMSQWKFLPGGRITANAGTGREKATLYNCFVYNPQDFGITDIDSMEIIFDTLKKSAKILASEGGLGINVSYIRPNGSYIVGTGVRTPGVVKFLQMWDKASQIITMGSTKDLNDGKLPKKKIRKGAMMASLSVHHGDIKQFITAKQQSNRLSRFNLSVLISDKFMNAVQNDQMWQIGFPDTSWQSYSKLWDGNIDGWVAKKYPFVVSETLPARELWNLIMMSTYTRNEPGVLFFDTLNDYNPVKYIQTIMTTNPCLTGDTLIAVADGRNAVTIRQLAQQGREFPVYSMGQKVQIVSGKAFKTKQNATVVRVILDDNSIFLCTPDHKIMLRNGLYKEAKDLKEKDSLMSFNSYISNKQYRQISSNVSRDRRQYRLMIAQCNNHKVKRVQFLQQKYDVYDITVNSNNHNFGIITSHKDEKFIESSGVFVHNCGEIGMSSGVCNLGSLNLPRFFKDGGFDYDSFEQAIKYGVCFLDGVCDVSYIPLPQYYQKVQDFRRIGLGVTGLGSLLSMLGLKFGSYEAIKFVDQLFKFKCQIQLITSAFLGKSKGSFLKFNRQQYFSSKWWYQLPISYQIKRQIERIGYMRNAVHSDVPPSGNCQIPSSAIITEQGIKTLKEIFQQNLITSKHEEMKWYIPIKPLNVLTLQGFKRITGLYKNKTGKTLKIKTKSGNIQGTEEHKVLVKLTEDTATWKKLGQLKAGEKILFYKE